jgi:hypothetical protein
MPTTFKVNATVTIRSDTLDHDFCSEDARVLEDDIRALGRLSDDFAVHVKDPFKNEEEGRWQWGIKLAHPTATPRDRATFHDAIHAIKIATKAHNMFTRIKPTFFFHRFKEEENKPEPEPEVEPEHKKEEPPVWTEEKQMELLQAESRGIGPQYLEYNRDMTQEEMLQEIKAGEREKRSSRRTYYALLSEKDKCEGGGFKY